MEEIVLSKDEFVYMFGTDKQKEKFRKTNTLQSNVRDSIMRTAMQHYKEVKIAKRGVSNVFVLSGKNEAIQDRRDGRKSNGGERSFPDEFYEVKNVVYMATNKC